MKRHFNNNRNSNPVFIRGLSIEVTHGNVDRALKKLRKRIDEDGRLKEFAEREHFVTPSEKKRIAKKRAVMRHKRELSSKKLDTRKHK